MDESMDESNEGMKQILNSYKEKNKPILLITQQDFCYTSNILKVFEDSVLFADKFNNQILLKFEQIKQVGGGRR